MRFNLAGARAPAGVALHGKRTAAVGDNPNGRSAGAYLATQALRKAPFAVKRQVFQAFDLQIAYDAVEHRAEISATVTEAVPEARDNARALLAEGSSVVVTDIAGARFVSRCDARIVERVRLTA